MVNRDYATRVLFALSFQDLCGYQISKYISTKEERISSGTIQPVLRHLLEKDLVSYSVKGRRKVYSLTQDGQRYVAEIRSIRETLKKRIFVDSLNENALFMDFLSNLDDAKYLRDLLEYIGDEIMSIVRAGFLMQKNNETGSLEYLKDTLKEISEEVNSRLLHETQN